ncbi:MAG: M15 family metallopeptidase [Clostridiales bacterium]|nr:M15 family metallopeptidase [Clostridiales bacterium]MDO4350445.1 M15 family metallopeptidase [Eubacteriales bacterium]MDY4007315.1 M15 family metallopeptidase [Candidatus Limiplasma sp.]
MLLEKVISIVALSATLLNGSMKTAMPDKNIDGTVYLVNRQHAVSKYFVPEVRKVDAYGMSQQMRGDAAAALEEMFAAAKEEGIGLSTVSGYRSYSKQSSIYSRKKATQGQEAADRVSARPGTSEHQLGLAMDIAKKGSSQLNTGFGKTKEGQWVNENAHRFGFIVRYMEGYEEITGYMYEPWHVRYVGKEQAKAIYESGVPMETYMSGYKLGVYDFLIHQATNE